MNFFDLINYHPRHIVFINDKKSHFQDVEKSVELKSIHFIGLRYGFRDQKVANFSKEIAEWAHSTLDHLLSDE